jgi:hypothetical protein
MPDGLKPYKQVSGSCQERVAVVPSDTCQVLHVH